MTIRNANTEYLTLHTVFCASGLSCTKQQDFDPAAC